MLRRISELDWPRLLYTRKAAILLGIGAVLSVAILVIIHSNVDEGKLSPLADIAFTAVAAVSPAGFFALLVCMAFFWLRCDSSSKAWRTMWFFALLFGFAFGSAVAYYALVYLPALKKRLRHPEQGAGEFDEPLKLQKENGRIGPFSRAFLIAWGVGLVPIAVVLFLPNPLPDRLLMPTFIVSFLLCTAAMLEAIFHTCIFFYRSGMSRPAAVGQLDSPGAKDRD
ncbi:MAG TPA: hypothetical protein VGR47_13975 [Terracidiphilus sp.]|nr:hypothetical protein [Terracidiphilus sp.]